MAMSAQELPGGGEVEEAAEATDRAHRARAARGGGERLDLRERNSRHNNNEHRSTTAVGATAASTSDA